jgi:Domain of unknown function (DUF1707)
MRDLQKMRASDADRQEVVERLRAALDEGRLKMEEYLERMALASEAVTYGDLAPLYADLPESGSLAPREPAAPAPAPNSPAPPPAIRRGGLAALPTPLKVLWTIWGAIVAVNVVVWGLASATTDAVIYPWPLWVAGPWGAALFGLSAGVTQIRRSRRAAAPPRLPAGKGGA